MSKESPDRHPSLAARLAEATFVGIGAAFVFAILKVVGLPEKIGQALDKVKSLRTRTRP